MNNRTHRWSVGVVLALAACALLATAGLPALAYADPNASPSARVKYYVVVEAASGQPETLADIARQVLGSEDRAAEIVELNQGRPQLDGGALGSDGRLRVGWVLVLPWDAVGDGVRYGRLPDAPGGATDPVPTDSPTSPAPTDAPASNCPQLPAPRPAGSAWAQQRLAVPDVWSSIGRGSGVIVAVVDSGVDAGVVQLAGRVSVGVDIVSGTASGAVDCLGSGTAMAALIVADDGQHLLGVAPDATVLPVRIAVDQPNAAASDQAIAIDVATSAGARVIALGSYVDVSLPGVRQAIHNAAAHDVVVVAAGPIPNDGSLPPELLRVGVLSSDGRVAQQYPPGSVDVVAPGQDVTSVGPAGQGPVAVSGSEYAVALAAAAAALVRGASPALPAADVVRQLRATATPVEPASRDSGPTSGVTPPLVNPLQAAVAQTTGMPVRAIADAPEAAAGSARRAVLVAAVMLVLLAVLALAARRMLKRPAPPSGSDQSDEWS